MAESSLLFATLNNEFALHLTPNGIKALAKIKRLAERHEWQLLRHLGARRHRQLIDALREFG